ncbi:ABC transporter permease subunit [Rossellomorea marisflavi]|uniref:ABC transporter permease subunit n=1 Tax=Rossellomorea marisflavi TaxID=189381 RepID=UPI003457C3B3
MYIRIITSMFFKFLLVSLGIVLLSSLIGLFTGGIHLDLMQYLKNVIRILSSFVHYKDLTITNSSNNTYSMFPAFWGPYFYSVIIFLCAVILSITIGLSLAFIAYILPRKWSNPLLKICSIVEAIPDLFILIVIQYSVIFILNETGYYIFPIVGAQEKVYFVPIVTLAILPSILLFRITYMLIHNELNQTYVLLVQSKGFSKSYIFFVHILRNISFSLLNHSKSIILFILSSLIVFERLFNIYGITHFVTSFPQMEVISFSLILFYLPVFTCLCVARIIIERSTGQKVVV